MRRRRTRCLWIRSGLHISRGCLLFAHPIMGSGMRDSLSKVLQLIGWDGIMIKRKKYKPASHEHDSNLVIS